MCIYLKKMSEIDNESFWSFFFFNIVAHKEEGVIFPGMLLILSHQQYT